METQNTPTTANKTAAAAAPPLHGYAQLAAAAEDRADALKTAGDTPAALAAAIQSAELYFRAVQSAAPSVKAALERKCSAILAKAEQWKDPGTPRPPPSPRKRPDPKPVGTPSTKEQMILLKSSKLTTGIFPPWKGPPTSADFPDGPFLDPAGTLTLSESQQRILDGWKRPHEIFGDNARILPEPDTNFDLTQDVITDCSVVASLCAATNREEKGFGQTVSQMLYPQDDRGRPVVSPSGKYIVKLFFNGCFRRVVIDDLLPASSSGRSLFTTCRRNPAVFAPALIEKAYLKIMGGYDFPGSNSGTDLLALTGWIPEHIFLQSDEVIFSALWKRMYRAWETGDVLVTLGTGRMSVREEVEWGLVGEHDYAVLEMKEEDGERMLLVKNPWSEGTVWKGNVQDDEEDENWDIDTSRGAFDVTAVKDALLAARPPLQPGTFWISLHAAARHFASLYINWNPTLFTHVSTRHFVYDLSTKITDASFATNPQFSITSTDTPVYILLTRHCGLPDTGKGFIALYLFSGGNRIFLTSGSTTHTPHVDSPQTLLVLPTLPGTPQTLAISTQSLPNTPQPFTLHLFSLSPLPLTPAPSEYPYTQTVTTTWTPSPQFSLSLPSPTPLVIVLESESIVPALLTLAHGRGLRILPTNARDIIATSGEYKRGATLLSARELPAGAYTLIASTFTPLADSSAAGFRVTVMALVDGCRIREIPPETAGCFEVVRTGRWRRGQTKVVLAVDVGRIGRVLVRAEVEGGAEVQVGVWAGRKEVGGGARTSGWVDVFWREGGWEVVLERREGLEAEGAWKVVVVSEAALWVGEEEEDEDDEEEEEE